MTRDSGLGPRAETRGGALTTWDKWTHPHQLVGGGREGCHGQLPREGNALRMEGREEISQRQRLGKEEHVQRPGGGSGDT